ncbi:MAG TPA: N-formylglutamate deformylase [Azospirillaceae bacterium]|nr:N-formylglutamate deformylase [Azospirillaceae bacterium]
MEPYRFHQGTAPLLISMPHVGLRIPDELRPRLTREALAVPDTDWHIDRLYDFTGELGASVLMATKSRYVVDLNRPSDDSALYPGQSTPGLFPTETFEGAALYQDSQGPDAADKARRVETYWRPYHDRLRSELDRLVADHGYALLWEAHSIAPVLPKLFDGRLPDINLGSNGGASCPAGVAGAVLRAAEGAGYTAVLDGRFKGGHITRHYGRADSRVLALQLELSQATYLAPGEPPDLDPILCARIRPVIRGMIGVYMAEAALHFG